MCCPGDYSPVNTKVYAIILLIFLAVVIFFAVVDSSTLARWFFV